MHPLWVEWQQSTALRGEGKAHSRGILMVHTFSQGKELPNGKTKQWVIGPQDGQPVAIVVIWEEWHNGPEALLLSCRSRRLANTLIAPITDRMPAILLREAWATWLGETDGPLPEGEGATTDIRGWQLDDDAAATIEVAGTSDEFEHPTRFALEPIAPPEHTSTNVTPIPNRPLVLH